MLAIIFGSLASLALVVLVAVIMALLGYEDTDPLAWIIGQVLLWVYFTWLLRNHSPWSDPERDSRPDGPIRDGRHGERVYQKDGVRRVSIPVKNKNDSPPSQQRARHPTAFLTHRFPRTEQWSMPMASGWGESRTPIPPAGPASGGRNNPPSEVSRAGLWWTPVRGPGGTVDRTIASTLEQSQSSPAGD